MFNDYFKNLGLDYLLFLELWFLYRMQNLQRWRVSEQQVYNSLEKF